MSVVRLTHFTDPHLYGERRRIAAWRADATGAEPRRSRTRRRATGRPDAVLVTGDLVQDDPAGYPHFRRLFGALGAAGAVPARQSRRAARR